MYCLECNYTNDADAEFCVRCGKPIVGDPHASPARLRKAYLFVLALVPIVLVVIGVGYYKFFLPDGVAAVVNGEEIKFSELTAVVSRAAKMHEASFDRPVYEGEQGKQALRRLRYEVLMELIKDRIVLQEAGKAGIRIPRADIEAALSGIKSSLRMDEAGFEKYVESSHGSMRAFEDMVKKRLMISKFISERVVAGVSDPGEAGAKIGKWLQEASGRASVRIALSEQWAAASSGCCGNNGKSACGSDGGCGRFAAGRRPAPEVEKFAATAGLKYWHEKYGQDLVSARVMDFGCHIQVDIMKNNKIVSSLWYQDGKVAER